MTDLAAVCVTDEGSSNAFEDALARVSKARWTYWDFYFILKALEAAPRSAVPVQAPPAIPVPANLVQAPPAQPGLPELQSDVAALRVVIDGIQTTLATFISLQAPPAGQGTDPMVPAAPAAPAATLPTSSSDRSHVSDTPAPDSRRAPPAPTFSGTREGVKIATWLEQFKSYCSILKVAPSQMTEYAALCLKDKAAEHWASMKKTLLSQSRDVSDFQVFCFAMLEHYVDTSVENTVRLRLSKLRQTGTVAEFHAKFRDIMVEAVTCCNDARFRESDRWPIVYIR